jgi:predicted DNA-binding protein
MTLRSDGRRVISATMQPELYEQLRARCKELDTPLTVFVREAIKAALAFAPDAEPTP